MRLPPSNEAVVVPPGQAGGTIEFPIIECGQLTHTELAVDLRNLNNPNIEIAVELETSEDAQTWAPGGAFTRRRRPGPPREQELSAIFAYEASRYRFVRGRLTVTGGPLVTSAVLRWAQVARAPHDAHHSIAFVQSVAVQSVGAPTSLTTPAMNTTTGNMLVADAAIGFLGALFSSLTDNNSLPWTLAVGPASSAGPGDENAQIRQFVNTNIAGRSGHTFTQNATEDIWQALAVSEHSGQAQGSAVDATATGSDTSTTTSHSTGLSGTTTQGAEIIRVAGTTHPVGATLTIGAGYTEDQNLPSTASPNSIGLITGYAIVGTVGQFSFTWSSSSSLAAPSVLGTYKEAIAVSGGTPGAEDRGVIIVRPHTRWGWRG